jgi:PadR family transcriptional regulator PadR
MGISLGKENLKLLVLAVLADGPAHGYALAREIERRSKGVLTSREGTLYPTLRTLEQEGIVSSSWQPVPAGAARRVYAITEAGLGELAQQTESWDTFATAISGVLRGGAA